MCRSANVRSSQDGSDILYNVRAPNSLSERNERHRLRASEMPEARAAGFSYFPHQHKGPLVCLCGRVCDRDVFAGAMYSAVAVLLHGTRSTMLYVCLQCLPRADCVSVLPCCDYAVLRTTDDALLGSVRARVRESPRLLCAGGRFIPSRHTLRLMPRSAAQFTQLNLSQIVET